MSDDAKSETNTRLNIGMQALLGIIAGLIVSDMLKATVATIATGSANAFVLLAATVFIVRVLVDNILFYNLEDVARGKSDAYFFRVALIVCDLVSYSLCYAIVGRLANEEASVVKPHGVGVAVWLFCVVEALHFI